MTLHCRITKIDIERFQVELTSKTSDLVDDDNKWKYVVIVVTLPTGGLQSIVMSMSVCLSVCLSARITRKPHGRTSPIFCAFCLWLRLNSPLTAL